MDEIENKINKKVAEYQSYIAEADLRITGRVFFCEEEEAEELKYSWEISHYCKPSEKAGVYIPSSRNSKTFEGARGYLFGYMKTFTNLGIDSNEYF